METTYTIKHKESPSIWEFKYSLNGDLTSFKVLDSPLTPKQIKFLFSSNFPSTESVMKSLWLKQVKTVFEITIGEVDLSFDTFYSEYKYKVKKVVAERAWKKLSKSDKMGALSGISKYDGFLHRKQTQSKANPATYLNQRYWEDGYGAL